MSKHLTVSESVALLEELRGLVRDFSAREAELNLDFRNRHEAASKRLAHQTGLQAAQTKEELANTEQAFSSAQANANAKFKQRKDRIARALKSSQRQASEKIDHTEGRKKYSVQKGTLDAERSREERLKQNDAWLVDFETSLAQSREAFADLEQRAEKGFRGFRKFRQLLAAPQAPHTELPPDDAVLATLNQLHESTTAEIIKFRGLALPLFFRIVPLWIWVLLIGGGTFALSPILKQLGIAFPYERIVRIAGSGLTLLIVLLYVIGLRQASHLATSIAQALAVARRLQELGSVRARTRHAEQIEQIEKETRERIHELNQIWDSALQDAAAAREALPKRLDEKLHRIAAKNEERFREQAELSEKNHLGNRQSVQSLHEQRTHELQGAHKATVAKWNTEEQAAWLQLETEWKSRLTPILSAIKSEVELAEKDFPAWDAKVWTTWTSPKTFKNAAQFGSVQVDLKSFAESVPADPRLSLPFAGKFSLPLVLAYPEQGSILFETKSDGAAAIASINNIIFRLLEASPAGKLSFTIIDPVKLGQNFATVMHLADYEENLIGGRIWTQPTQIEEQLRDLNEHMEKVIQMYLRNEYATIAEYNLEAGNIAEKYHFVVIADFPANFTDVAARRLLHIAASGARCGVYTLIHWDQRYAAPVDFLPEDLRKSSVCISVAGDQFLLTNPPLKRVKLLLDAPPNAAAATEFLHRIGEANRGSNRVEVPFAQVAPPATKIWTESTTEELRVPIGRSGATKLQYLSLGRGTRQHALIAGKTGSGKSTLFHVIITNLALWCSPEEVEFYLIDFKKGVEFKGYADARLPHARVVAIESDREFGLSVLQRVDEELKLRGELFRKLGVQDVPGYKRSGGGSLPRSLLMIDEFQELFVEDDRISQAAAMLLDRIVRQGRAFGIHVILGSQTLGGAYTLARTTIGQMVIRIALQCNEADAYLIMDENNPAPRLLSRPGEGIYNDMAGNTEGNSPFQAVWISDRERDEYLHQVRALADSSSKLYTGPIVFEGNAPADIRGNHLLQSVLQAPAEVPATAPRIWLGAPNSIKGPTEVVFEGRSGNNLLMVGQRDEAVLAMLSIGLVALSAQFPVGAVRFVLFESALPGSNESAFLDRLIEAIPHKIERPRLSELDETMKSLSDALKSRNEQEQGSEPTTFLFIRDLQNFKKLRAEDDFSFSSESNESPATQLNKLIAEGPSHGIHVIATLDTYNNVNRFIGRKGLSEFEMRVLFQMSANDSASLCDDPRASQLGLHRALLFNEHEGYLETFRPYAIPSLDWVDYAKSRLLASRGAREMTS